MLRIYFTSDDVARTRLAPAPDPLWETMLSLHLLRSGRADMVFGSWRRSVVADLRDSALVPEMRLLFALNPPTGYFPDFLTPLDGVDGMDAGLEAIAATPTRLLKRDLAILGEAQNLPAAMVDLASGQLSIMNHLIATIRAYHEVAVRPEWSQVEAVVQSDRARRVSAVARLGAEGLLESLRPTMRWNSGELEVDYPFDREIDLAGRGLILVPSYFCWRYPVTLVDPELPPVLVYPAERTSVPMVSQGDHQALGALLGHTRAAALAAIGDSCSTTELARRIGVSAAAASQHATVLRNAGLVRSRRERNLMLHSVTRLGLAVLTGR